jgi:hypothetical protein
VFLARWLLGFDAGEWWDMDYTSRTAYERGMREFLPLILFGVDGVDPQARQSSGDAASLSDLPGGVVVKADA